MDGVPVIVDESKSLFRIEECVASADTVERPRTWKDVARTTLERAVPRGSENLRGRQNLQSLAARLRRENERPRVLVLGGASLGIGTESMIFDPAFEVVESDIVFGPRTNLVCDAHQIPFADGTFDAVVAQGLFEYLIDPFRAAEEIHRVLKPTGYAYIESPFMQQVHGGAYDFFRFTHVGHRALFRHFQEVDSGVVCGPSMALTWACRYFLRCFTKSVPGRALANTVANAATGWFTRFDRSLKDTPGAYDAASAFFFLGRRSETSVSGREIISGYRGVWKMHR